MIDLQKIESAAQDALWTGRWYDAGCNPVPFGIVGHIANCDPTTILKLIAVVRAAKDVAQSYPPEISVRLRLQKALEGIKP